MMSQYGGLSNVDRIIVLIIVMQHCIVLNADML